MKRHSTPEYEKRLKIAMKAFEAGCVIFSMNTQKWYSPREFIESDEVVVFKMYGMEERHNFTLFYPKFAIQKKMEDLKKAELDFENYIDWIMNAFEFSPKQKNKVTK